MSFFPLKKSILLLSLISSNVLADIQAQNSSLSFSQRALSTTANPADAAIAVERDDSHVMTGGMINLGGALEYGNLDELFELYNDISNDFEPSEPPDGTPVNPIEPPPKYDGIDWDKIFEKYPELEDQLDAIKDQVVDIASLLALIATEGYGKAELDLEIPLILNEDLWGGTLMMGFSAAGYSKANGILEEIIFDSDQARSELEKIPDIPEDAGIQELDLSGGITLVYDPFNKNAKVWIDNDSLLLVKAAMVNEFMLSYSKKAFENEYGSLYWGVRPTLYYVGMTNLGVRLGDLDDAEAIFDDIKNGDYIWESGFDFDLGLTWSSKHYQLGLSLDNVVESTYDYPEIDRRRYSSIKVLEELDYHESFTLDRQLTLQAAIYTEDRNWSLSMDLDANPIKDPMKDRFQWLSVSAGYAADSWWLPSARVGFSRNLVGSELAYLTAGITFAKFINLDVSSTLDTVTIDDTDYMRGLNITLGVQFDY